MSNIVYRYALENTTQGKIYAVDPKGFEEMDLVLTRDEKFMAISNEMTEIELGFLGEARTFIQAVLDAGGADGGIDGEITIDLDISEDGGLTFENLFDGITDFATLNREFNAEDGHFYNAVFLRSDFHARFMNHLDTEIDVNSTTDIYGDTRETINSQNSTLHNQTVRKEFIATPDQVTITELAVLLPDTFFAIPQLDDVTVDDLKDATELVAALQIVAPSETDFILKDKWLQDEDLIFIVDGTCNFTLTDTGGSGNIVSVTMQWFVQRNADAEVAIGASTVDVVGATSSDTDHTVVLASATISDSFVDDEFRIYCKIIVAAAPDNKDATYKVLSAANMDLIQITIRADDSRPVTNATSFRVHEVGNRIVDNITGTDSRFFSNYLGNRASQIQSYTADGCGSFNGLFQGFQIRGKTLAEAPWKMSFEDYFDGLDALYNLGLVVEESGGSDRVRIEPKHFFFQSGAPVLKLENVNITRAVANELIVKEADFGFSKWQSEEIDSLDDWSAAHSYANRFKNVGEKRSVFCGFVAATYAIEFTRRTLSTKTSSFDNDVFIIAANRTVAGGVPTSQSTPEKNENFIDINNILFEADAYNARHSPARSFLRWGNILNVGLVDYAAEDWLFQGGEGNLEFESRIEGSCEGSFNNQMLGENDDIQWDYSASPSNPEQTPLFKPYWISFETNLSFTDYKVLRDNKTNSFEITESDGNVIEVFLWNLSYNPFTALGTFRCVEANV